MIHIDDSDVVKPDGFKFESLGIVRDGSESTSTKNVYKKGYPVTEACVLTTSNHPVSIFSRIHSSSEKNYKSANTITFDAIAQGAALFSKATFVMDRGYDDNKMFLKLDELGQEYVIRLTSKRKLLYHNKWTPTTELRNRRKGKVKTNVFYKGKDHEAYLSHVKVQITASRKNIYLVLIYGIPGNDFNGIRNKCTKSCNYKNSRPCEGKSFLLLLLTGKRHLRHTFIYQRGRQTLVPDKTSCIPSTLP